MRKNNRNPVAGELQTKIVGIASIAIFLISTSLTAQESIRINGTTVPARLVELNRGEAIYRDHLDREQRIPLRRLNDEELREVILAISANLHQARAGGKTIDLRNSANRRWQLGKRHFFRGQMFHLLGDEVSLRAMVNRRWIYRKLKAGAMQRNDLVYLFRELGPRFERKPFQLVEAAGRDAGAAAKELPYFRIEAEPGSYSGSDLFFGLGVDEVIQQLVTVGGERACRWALGDGRQERVFSFQPARRQGWGAVTSRFVAVSEDGRFLISRNVQLNKQFYIVWDSQSGDAIYRFVPGWEKFAFSRDSKWLAFPIYPIDTPEGDNKTLQSGLAIVDLKTKNVLELEPVEGGIRDLSFNQDESLLLATNWRELLVWDVPTGKLLHRQETSRGTRCFFADGNKILVTGHGEHTLLDLKTGTPIAELRTPDPPKLFWFSSLSDDSRLAVGGVETGRIYVWNIDQGMSAVVPAHDDPIKTLKLSPDGDTLVSTEQDSDRLKVWDVNGTTLTLMADVDVSDAKENWTAIFSSDGGKLICFNHREARVWDVASIREGRFQLAGEEAIPEVPAAPNDAERIPLEHEQWRSLLSRLPKDIEHLSMSCMSDFVQALEGRDFTAKAKSGLVQNDVVKFVEYQGKNEYLRSSQSPNEWSGKFVFRHSGDRLASVEFLSAPEGLKDIEQIIQQARWPNSSGELRHREFRGEKYLVTVGGLAIYNPDPKTLLVTSDADAIKEIIKQSSDGLTPLARKLDSELDGAQFVHMNRLSSNLWWNPKFIQGSLWDALAKQRELTREEQRGQLRLIGAFWGALGGPELAEEEGKRRMAKVLGTLPRAFLSKPLILDNAGMWLGLTEQQLEQLIRHAQQLELDEMVFDDLGYLTVVGSLGEPAQLSVKLGFTDEDKATRWIPDFKRALSAYQKILEMAPEDVPKYYRILIAEGELVREGPQLVLRIPENKRADFVTRLTVVDPPVRFIPVEFEFQAYPGKQPDECRIEGNSNLPAGTVLSVAVQEKRRVYINSKLHPTNFHEMLVIAVEG